MPEAQGAPKPLRVSVAIPHLEQPELLADCLDRLARQTDGDFELVEILVADNGSVAGRDAAAVCAGRPGVRLIDASDTPGPGHARNIAVAAAQGELIAFTDADCRPDPGWLAGFAAAFRRTPAPDVAGGDIRVGWRDPARPTAAEAYESVFAFRARKYVERDGYAATANMAATARILREVGPFGGIDMAEDADWGRRAVAAGARLVFAPEAVVEHPARESFAELARKWDRLVGQAWAEVRDGRRGRGRWVLKALLLAVSAPAELPRILGARRLPDLRARALAFGVLLAIRLHRAGLMLRLAVRGDRTGVSGRAWRRGGAG